MIRLLVDVGLSPTRPDSIKPDVVFEAGNVGFDGQVGDATLFAGLTTHHAFQTRLFDLMYGTSEAAAHCGWFVAQLLRDVDNVIAQTIRGLVVHSANWTPAMLQQFPNLDERLAAFGLGVPDLSYAWAVWRSAPRSSSKTRWRMRNSLPFRDHAPRAGFERSKR